MKRPKKHVHRWVQHPEWHHITCYDCHMSFSEVYPAENYLYWALNEWERLSNERLKTKKVKK
jgi:hypothetical protein